MCPPCGMKHALRALGGFPPPYFLPHFFLPQVLENISKHQLAEHLADVLPTVQAALTDSDPGVRRGRGGGDYEAKRRGGVAVHNTISYCCRTAAADLKYNP